MLSAIFYFILFIGVIVFILISMGVLLVGSKANEYHNGTAYNKARRTVDDLFFMILDKNKYFCESTFGDKMIIRRITNNE